MSLPDLISSLSDLLLALNLSPLRLSNQLPLLLRLLRTNTMRNKRQRILNLGFAQLRESSTRSSARPVYTQLVN